MSFRRVLLSFPSYSTNFRALFSREIMVGSNQVLERVEKRAVEAEQMVELLKRHIDCLQKTVGRSTFYETF